MLESKLPFASFSPEIPTSTIIESQTQHQNSASASFIVETLSTPQAYNVNSDPSPLTEVAQLANFHTETTLSNAIISGEISRQNAPPHISDDSIVAMLAKHIAHNEIHQFERALIDPLTLIVAKHQESKLLYCAVQESAFTGDHKFISILVERYSFSLRCKITPSKALLQLVLQLNNPETSKFVTQLLSAQMEANSLLIEKGFTAQRVSRDTVGSMLCHPTLCQQLIKAIENDDRWSVLYYLEQGVDINQTSCQTTFLHTAVNLNRGTIVETLLINGANPNIKNWHDECPLYVATGDKNISMVELLLAYFADPFAVNRDGDTALHLASQRGEVTIAALLLENNASIEWQNNQGMTPWDYATRYNHSDLLALFNQEEMTDSFREYIDLSLPENDLRRKLRQKRTAKFE
ncbi:MAG: ankyrin repeat domain-containing protein [Parashewanella sp.]